MTAAEQSAKEDTTAAPKGCVKVAGPDGATMVWTKPPRGPGPWFRVKHLQFGHRLIQANTEDEALAKFFAEFAPGFATDPAWCKESMRLNGGRIARLPGSEPAEAPKQTHAAPERAKK
jgi:hypothetical protein